MASEEPTLKYDVPLEDAEVLDYFEECRSRSSEVFKDRWDESAKMYKMYYGETQDLSKNLQKTSSLPMPTARRISANLGQGTINAIIGADQADRKEAVFRGFGNDDQDAIVAQWATTLVRHAMNKCGGFRHQVDILLDLLIGGYGFSETFLETSKYPLSVATTRVQPWEMLPDPEAQEDNLADARFWIRKRSWTLEEVQARWPEKSEDLEKIAQQGVSLAAFPKIPQLARAKMSRTNKVDVFDFVYKRFVPRAVWTDPKTQEQKDTTLDELEAAQQQIMAEYEAALLDYKAALIQAQLQAAGAPPAPEGMPMQAPELPQEPPPPAEIAVDYQYPGQTWSRAFILSDAKAKAQLLEHKTIPIAESPYKAATGFKFKDMDSSSVRFFGMMQVISDLQFYVNRTLNVYLETLARNAKGGGFIGKSALIGDANTFIAEQSIPGFWHVVEDEGIPLIREKGGGAPVHNFDRFLEILLSLLQQVSGVTDYLKGTAKQERSNVLISNLQAQSIAMLNPIMEQLTTLRMDVGKLMLELSLKFLPDETVDATLGQYAPKETMNILYEEQTQDDGSTQVVPKVGEDGQPLTPSKLMKLRDPLRFDVVVDVGSASPTSKQAVWQVLEQGVMQALLDALKDAGLDIKPVLVELVRSMPLQGSTAKVLADQIEQSADQQKKLETSDGIAKALAGLGPEEAAGVIAQVQQMLTAPQQQQQPGGPNG